MGCWGCSRMTERNRERNGMNEGKGRRGGDARGLD